MSKITYPLTLIEPGQQGYGAGASFGACCEPDEHGRCVTCSDDAQRMTVISVMDDGMTAVVELNGVVSEVDITLVDDVSRGQILLVHGGVALEKLVV